jgi:peroxiredoxin
MVEGQAPGRSAIGRFALLAGAIAVAGGVTAYLFLSGDDGASPAATGFSTPTATGSSDDGDPRLGPLVPGRPEIGEPAPDFALVDARDGTVRKLSDYRGRAVIVNWYASWCGPCRREIPEFNAMLEAVGDDRIVVLGIDYQESAGDAVGILDELEASYPALLDSDAEVADHYRVGNRIPSSFFVDAEGILRAQRIGQVTPEQLAEDLATLGINWQPEED